MCNRENDNAGKLKPINQTVGIIVHEDAVGIVIDTQSDLGVFAQLFSRADDRVAKITCDTVSGVVPIKPHRFAEFHPGVILPGMPWQSLPANLLVHRQG